MNTPSPPIPDRLVCFAHGKESGPWGTKIKRLAQVARAAGYAVMSPDYSHTHDARVRVRELLDLAPRASEALVLAGSSMGGYVAAMACAALKPQALFLMAPALYFPGVAEEPGEVPALCEVVHGWRDTMVSPDRAWRFARHNNARLHMLDSNHSLVDQLPVLEALFTDLLRRAAP